MNSFFRDRKKKKKKLTLKAEENTFQISCFTAQFLFFLNF